MMSNYYFEIKEIGNGWLVSGMNLLQSDFYRTLNELCSELLRYVDDDSPPHRNTGGGRIRENMKREETND